MGIHFNMWTWLDAHHEALPCTARELSTRSHTISFIYNEVMISCCKRQMLRVDCRRSAETLRRNTPCQSLLMPVLRPAKVVKLQLVQLGSS